MGWIEVPEWRVDGIRGKGVHPKVVQERLGHAKVGTTLDIYSHVMPGLQQAAALRFEEGLAAYADAEPSAEPVLG